MENGRGKSTLKAVLFLLLLLGFLSTGGYLVYEKFFMKEEVVEKEEEKEKEIVKELDTNSGLVQSLYANVSGLGNSCFLNLDIAKEETIRAQDIEDNIKWKMGYDLVKVSDFEKVNCNSYAPTDYFDSELLKGDSSVALGCGDGTYNQTAKKFATVDGQDATTDIVLEEKMKGKVDLIFGPGTYKRIDKVENGGIWYKYVEKASGYVTLYAPMGGTCLRSVPKLISAEMKKDQIILIENREFQEGNYQFTYTFQKGSDESYYFNMLAKKKI